MVNGSCDGCQAMPPECPISVVSPPRRSARQPCRRRRGGPGGRPRASGTRFRPAARRVAPGRRSGCRQASRSGRTRFRGRADAGARRRGDRVQPTRSRKDDPPAVGRAARRATAAAGDLSHRSETAREQGDAACVHEGDRPVGARRGRGAPIGGQPAQTAPIGADRVQVRCRAGGAPPVEHERPAGGHERRVLVVGGQPPQPALSAGGVDNRQRSLSAPAVIGVRRHLTADHQASAVGREARGAEVAGQPGRGARRAATQDRRAPGLDRIRPKPNRASKRSKASCASWPG